MYIPIIIISSAIDVPEASSIIDDEEDMDEGVVDGVKGEEGTDDDVIDKEDMNEEDRVKAGVLDKKVRNEEFVDERIEVEVPTNIKSTNECIQQVYLSLMY